MDKTNNLVYRFYGISLTALIGCTGVLSPDEPYATQDANVLELGVDVSMDEYDASGSLDMDHDTASIRRDSSAPLDIDAAPVIDAAAPVIDAAPPPSMCDNYPATNGLIEAGNPIRNYAYIDKTGTTHHLCELSDGTNRYAYFVYSSLTCGYCEEEAQYFEQFQRDNAANGLIVIEAMVDVVSSRQLNAWVGSQYNYHLIAVQPDPNQPQIDCTNTARCDSGYVPHHMLIDLTTMRILEPNCTNMQAILAHDRSFWQNCVNSHL